MIINQIETIHENQYNVTGSIKEKDQWEVLHDVSKDSSKSSQEGKRSKMISFASSSSSKKSLDQSMSNLSLSSINSMQNKIQIPVKSKSQIAAE